MSLNIRIELYAEFTNFINENYKDELEYIINRNYMNFIDKEVEASSFIVEKFLEFCKLNNHTELNSNLLHVYGLFNSQISSSLIRYEHIEKYVYVTHDPLYERVVCVHDKPNALCDVCVELNKERLEGAGPVGAYYLTESKHLIQTNEKYN